VYLSTAWLPRREGCSGGPNYVRFIGIRRGLVTEPVRANYARFIVVRLFSLEPFWGLVFRTVEA
jgi:hypothetical protein